MLRKLICVCFLIALVACGGDKSKPTAPNSTVKTEEFTGTSGMDERKFFSMSSAGPVTASFKQVSNNRAYIVLCVGGAYPCEIGMENATLSVGSMPAGTNSFYVSLPETGSCTYTVSITHPR